MDSARRILLSGNHHADAHWERVFTLSGRLSADSVNTSIPRFGWLRRPRPSGKRLSAAGRRSTA